MDMAGTDSVTVNFRNTYMCGSSSHLIVVCMYNNINMKS